MSLNPLTVAVVDDGGSMKAFAREDGPGAALRPQIATGKAFGAVGMGLSSRAINERVMERPHFGVALVGASDGRLVPVPGGVLIKDGGEIIGAVGVSGDVRCGQSGPRLCGQRLVLRHPLRRVPVPGAPAQRRHGDGDHPAPVEPGRGGGPGTGAC